MRNMTERMDAAVPMDAQNAPTGTWKTAQYAVSHSAHTPHRRSEKSTKITDVNPASHTKILTVPMSRIQDVSLPHDA